MKKQRRWARNDKRTQHNPYLLETDVKFNGQSSKINSQIEKFENQLLSDWIKNVPRIFYDEMNGY